MLGLVCRNIGSELQIRDSRVNFLFKTLNYEILYNNINFYIAVIWNSKR
jgi:hypothetical protein